MDQIKRLEASELTVYRGDRPIFENLGFSLHSGDLLKLVGPNGSGKSTLLKTLCGLIAPFSGDIKSGDHSILDDTDWISKHCCYLGHKNGLKREFTVSENIEFWATLTGQEQNISGAMEQLGILYLADTPVRYLSSGQLRRSALAKAICQNSAIWLFDEPTVGLDDQGLNLLSDVMTKHLDHGGIIICATHVDLGVVDEKIKTLDLANFTAQNAQDWEVW